MNNKPFSLIIILVLLSFTVIAAPILLDSNEEDCNDTPSVYYCGSYSNEGQPFNNTIGYSVGDTLYLEVYTSDNTRNLDAGDLINVSIIAADSDGQPTGSPTTYAYNVTGGTWWNDVTGWQDQNLTFTLLEDMPVGWYIYIFRCMNCDDGTDERLSLCHDSSSSYHGLVYYGHIEYQSSCELFAVPQTDYTDRAMSFRMYADSQAPESDAPTVTIDYPINGTTYNDYNGYVNVTATDDSGIGNCTINDSDWSYNGNETGQFLFYNSGYAAMADGHYSVNVTCNDTIGNEKTAITTFWIDKTNPTISYSDNGTMAIDNLTFQMNLTDNIRLYSFNISVDGALHDNLTNMTGTTYKYNGSFDASNYSIGEHNVTITVCDAHTKNRINPFNIKKTKDKITFDKTTSIESDISTKSITHEKKIDRYSYCFNYYQDYTVREFTVPDYFVHIDDPLYKGWFVDPFTNKWIDFEGDYDVEVTGRKVKVTSATPTKEFCFDSVGELNCFSESYNFYKYNTSVNYTAEVIEAQTDTVKFIIDKAKPITSAATLVWNNTNYNPTKSNSSGQDNYTVDISIEMFDQNFITNMTFYWNYSIDGTEYNSSNYNQTVYRIYISNCSDGLSNNKTIEFWIYKEADNTYVDGTLEMTIDAWHSDERNYRNYSFDFATSTNHSICIYPNWTSYYADAEILYDGIGYSAHTYELVNTTIKASTVKMIDLYLTNGTTLVTFTVTDQDNNEMEGVFIKVLKYDVGTGTYKTIEILETDYRGEAIGNIVLNTVWYKFILERNNIVLLETGGTKITGTSRTFRINTREDYFDLYDQTLGITHSLTFSNATKNFAFTYSDPNNNIHEGCLRVIKRTTTGDTVVNNSCLSSTAGTILVNIGTPGTETYVATGYVRFDDLLDLAKKIVHFDHTYKTYDTEGVFMSFLLITGLVMIGAWFPVISIIFLAVGMLLTNVLGIFHLNWTWLVGFVILAGITIYKLTRSQ